jgi:hypothetical protein
MTARAFDISDRRPESSASTLTRYRLDVIATSVDDVVRSAGGWLFDRAMAGWEVNLRHAEPSDARPLQILGINTVEPVADWPRTQAIAVAADVFNTEERVRENVVMALEQGLVEVTLWGDTWPPEFHRRAEAVQHHLSAAARAFKAQAVAVSELPPAPLTGTERFRSGSRWHPPYEPDLIPIG